MMFHLRSGLPLLDNGDCLLFLIYFCTSFRNLVQNMNLLQNQSKHLVFDIDKHLYACKSYTVIARQRAIKLLTLTMNRKYGNGNYRARVHRIELPQEASNGIEDPREGESDARIELKSVQIGVMERFL